MEIRENEKLACEVETMTEQMQELLQTYEQHKKQLVELDQIITTYRKEIMAEKKAAHDIGLKLREAYKVKNVQENKIGEAARRKHLLKTCIADVFVASAS